MTTLGSLGQLLRVATAPSSGGAFFFFLSLRTRRPGAGRRVAPCCWSGSGKGKGHDRRSGGPRARPTRASCSEHQYGPSIYIWCIKRPRGSRTQRGRFRGKLHVGLSDKSNHLDDALPFWLFFFELPGELWRCCPCSEESRDSVEDTAEVVETVSNNHAVTMR